MKIDLSKLGFVETDSLDGWICHVENSENSFQKIRMIEPFCGVIYGYSDCRSGKAYEVSETFRSRGNNFSIEYAHEGIYNTMLKDGSLLYNGVGDLSLSQNLGAVEAYNYPVGYYKGISIIFMTDEFDEETIALLHGFGLSLEGIFRSYLGNRRHQAFKANKELLAVLEGIYQLGLKGELHHLKIKILELLVMLSKEDTKIQNEYYHIKPRIVKAIMEQKEQIDQHPEIHRTILEMSEACSLSQSVFKESFARIIGYPPYAYLKKQRITRASILLRENDFSVEDVALRVGYENTSKFIKAFKAVAGITPGKYKMSKRAIPD